MEKVFTSEEVAHAVGEWCARGVAGFNVARAVETVNGDGSVTVAMWSFDDMRTIAAEGVAQSGRILSPSYVLTVSARVES
jgi:hypothetical protein